MAASSCRRGFSLIELLIVLGMIALLVGMLLPSIGVSVARARLTSDASALRQNFVATQLYAEDFRQVFPLARRNAFHAASNWEEALLASGHLERPDDADPRSYRRLGAITFSSSLAMVYDPQFMRPGWEVPFDQAIARAVYLYQVVYPSSKGYLFKEGDDAWFRGGSGVAWCCVEEWVFPAVMADGAVLFGTYRTFQPAQSPPLGRHGIGVPIFSTWGGFGGRDL